MKRTIIDIAKIEMKKRGRIGRRGSGEKEKRIEGNKRKKNKNKMMRR